jgi:hypothetical protein
MPFVAGVQLTPPSQTTVGVLWIVVAVLPSVRAGDPDVAKVVDVAEMLHPTLDVPTPMSSPRLLSTV